MKSSSRRPPGAVRIGVGVLITLGLGMIAYTSWAISYYLMWEDCPGYDDEGTVAAPESMQGRVMCSDSGTTGHYYILAVMIVLVIAALVVWLRRRALVATVALLVAAVVVPVPLAIGIQSLPDTCTSTQWDEFGAAGCETDSES